MVAFSQNEQLAQNYYDRGEFEKALLSYEELLKVQPNNFLYFQRSVDCYQQLQQFDKAEKAIQSRIERYKIASLYVELGYNYQLQKNTAKANQNYGKAVESIKENVSNVYAVANSFEKKVLLDYALQSYELASSLNENMRFNYQMGIIYGQMGKPDLMIEKYLEEAYANPNNDVLVKNQLSRFLMEEANEGFADLLRKALLVRVQKDQDLFWNNFLSWFFVQQKEYGKAFIQEKAIYKRNQDNFYAIVNLAEMAIEENENDIAKEILIFVLDNTQDLDLKIQSHYYLMQLRIESAQPKEYNAIAIELQNLIKQFGVTPYSLSLQMQEANFQTFYLKNPERGKEILKNSLNLPLNKYQIADAKMELADILLFEEKFNQALIYYSQIEEDLKNDVIGHEASLKVAKTSYYKTDFEWALTQLKVLKSSTTQLIANDAMELFLLLNDNTMADSTQTALKQFAKGDYLVYQKKYQEALGVFQQIAKENKGQEIEDETLFRLGTTFEKLQKPNEALLNYQEIIEKHPESIYMDEALYFSAEIENKVLNQPEKAKLLYEKILFSHQDSIYFVEARKKFRQLRGDSNS
jgi:tetratricopeptide (TPR) repeat protein